MKNPPRSVYITTTLPYINAEPHVGFAMEMIRADVLARYLDSLGCDVFFNTGTDEHGQKVLEKALEKGISPKEYCDILVVPFKNLASKLGVSENIHFIRTTDEHHMKAAQHFWNLVKKNGFIEKRTYQAKYCVGCELEKTDSELISGKCPLHPNREIELINEENYFFLFSKFKDKLLSIYEKDPNYVRGLGRFHEIRNLVTNGLRDFSISRLKSKMSWGIPVPDDPEHVMYVWFDALVNYISTLGWPNNETLFKRFWVDGDTYQYAGKDNLRQQAAMWQAMLMAAGLPVTKHIRIDGFINGEGGIKMSKSLGNVISPDDILDIYGVDALRYFLLRHIPAYEDGDISLNIFHAAYTAHLVNGLGNLASRILTLSEKYPDTNKLVSTDVQYDKIFIGIMETGNFDRALDFVWDKIGELDRFIAETEPYKAIKTDPESGVNLIRQAKERLYEINGYLEVFMPGTYARLKNYLDENIKPTSPLFPRISSVSAS